MKKFPYQTINTLFDTGIALEFIPPNVVIH